jgi:hypothetical protein
MAEPGWCVKCIKSKSVKAGTATRHSTPNYYDFNTTPTRYAVWFVRAKSLTEVKFYMSENGSDRDLTLSEKADIMTIAT